MSPRIERACSLFPSGRGVGLPEEGGTGVERGLKGCVSVDTLCGICGGCGITHDCILARFFSRAVISDLISKTSM